MELPPGESGHETILPEDCHQDNPSLVQSVA